MRKRDELSNPKSCLNKANDDEMLFVLLGRDPAASLAIRVWVRARITMGKNKEDDAQIQEALKIADEMELENKGESELGPNGEIY